MIYLGKPIGAKGKGICIGRPGRIFWNDLGGGLFGELITEDTSNPIVTEDTLEALTTEDGP